MTTLNNQHQLGYDLNGAQGKPLFTGTSAGDISVAITKPDELAASLTPPAVDPNDGHLIPNLDGGNATKLADIATDPTGPDAGYRAFVTGIGVAAQTINRRSDIQASVTQDVNSAREAATGVSLDEEMTNMLQYQHAYEAAAKVMSTIDETLDVLVNQMKR